MQKIQDKYLISSINPESTLINLIFIYMLRQNEIYEQFFENLVCSFFYFENRFPNEIRRVKF